MHSVRDLNVHLMPYLMMESFRVQVLVSNQGPVLGNDYRSLSPTRGNKPEGMNTP